MIAQIAIFIFGASAIYLVGRTDKWQRWGYIMGLLGQPFWVYVTITSEQWGILAMTTVYTVSWCIGIYNHWIKKPKSEPWFLPMEGNTLKGEVDVVERFKRPQVDPKTGEIDLKYDSLDVEEDIWIGNIPEGWTRKAFTKAINNPKGVNLYKCWTCRDSGLKSTDFAYDYTPCHCGQPIEKDKSPDVTVVDHINKIKD